LGIGDNQVTVLEFELLVFKTPYDDTVTKTTLPLRSITLSDCT